MSRGEVADLRIRRRLAQIADRLAELRARSQEMSGEPAGPEADRERLTRAAGRAGQARAHAAEAARLALAACWRSAEVHDRVADLYERLAAAGAGDTPRYEQNAGRHRRLAVGDREVAARRRGAGSAA